MLINAGTVSSEGFQDTCLESMADQQDMGTAQCYSAQHSASTLRKRSCNRAKATALQQDMQGPG